MWGVVTVLAHCVKALNYVATYPLCMRMRDSVKSWPLINATLILTLGTQTLEVNKHPSV